MAGGEVCFDLFTVSAQKLVRPTKVDVGGSSIKQCCTTLNALAETVVTDELKNDTHSLLEKYDSNFYSFVSIIIQKLEVGVWVDKEEMFSDSLGTYQFFGFAKDGDNNLVGYDFEWQKVLTTYGDGNYRFRFKEIDFQSNETETIYPFEFCLKEYTNNRANNSTVFTWYLTGLLGDYSVDEEVNDYRQVVSVVGSQGWKNSLRLDGIFGYNKSEYEKSTVRYSTGQEKWLGDKQIESYVWYSAYLDASVHSFIKTNMLQADNILVTDFNKNNPNTITEKAVNVNSSYEPNWQVNKLDAKVVVEFVQEYQNRIKKRC